MATHYDALIRVRITTNDKAWAKSRADELARIMHIRHYGEVTEAEAVSVEPAAPAEEKRA